MGQPAPSNSPHRLDSWKEIAAFFGRDERTVRRWERENDLPVHRVPGGARGRVFAYEDELRRWLGTPHAVNSESSAPEPHIGRIQNQTPDRIQPVRMRLDLRAAGKWAAALALFVVMAGGIVAYRRAHRFAVQASVATASRARTRDARTPATLEAEDFYLKGRYYWNKRTPEDLNRALDYFMQAVVHDPNYSQAYVGLADCYNLMREYTLMPSSEAYPRALAAAKRAVELDDQSSDAHASLAFVSFFGMWDIATGEREFRRAIDLNPDNPAPHHWYANGLLALHRWPEALAEIDRAEVLDPASSAILADKGNILMVAGRRDEALRLLKQMETRDPSFRSPHLYLKYIYLRDRDYPNFISELRENALLVHDNSALAIATAAQRGFAASGSRGLFEAMLQVQKKLYLQHSVPPSALAETCALLGNNNEALRYLRTAYEQRDSSLLFLEIYPEFNGLHDKPAYRNLLAQMNLPVQDTP